MLNESASTNGGTASLNSDGEPLERERELAAIQAALAEVRTGAGRLVYLEGAAGMGKSTLLRLGAELAAGAGLLVLRARTGEIEHELGFGAALELVHDPWRAAGAELRGRLLSGAAQLAAPLFGAGALAARTRVEEQAVVHGLFWLCLNLLAESGGRPGLAIVLDDAHWADEPSVRFLLYLAQRLDELPVLILLAARPLAQIDADRAIARVRDLDRTLVLGLQPLGEAAVVELVRRAWKREPAAEFSAACARVTAGNPFILAELLAELRVDGVDPTAEAVDRVDATTPEAVLRALRCRIASPDARAVAQAVAALDRATVAEAAEVAGIDRERCADVAQGLMQAGILAADQPLRFVHDLLSAALLRGMSLAERTELHVRAARSLCDLGAGPSRVAAQLLRAPDAHASWILQALRDAADEALSHGAPDPAARYLARALQEPLSSELRAVLLGQLGRAQSLAGDTRASATLAEAIAATADPVRRAELRHERGAALVAASRAVEAAEVFRRGLHELGDLAPALADRLRAAHISTAVFDSSLQREAVAQLRELGARARGAPPASGPLLAASALLCAYEGRPLADVQRLARRGWRDGALLHDDPEGESWLLMAWALLLAGDHELAAEIAQGAVEDARRRGSPVRFATASTMRAYAMLRIGLIVEALADVQMALDEERHGWTRYLGMASATAVQLHLERDDLASAKLELRRIEEGRYHGSLEAAYLLDARARLHTLELRPERALEDYLEAGRLLQESFRSRASVVLWRSGAAVAAHRLGRTAQARELCDAELDAAHRQRDPVRLGRALRAAGLLEGGKRGITPLREAVEVLESSSAGLEHAYALFDLGAALRRDGQRVESRKPLTRAVELADAGGAVWLRAHAVDELNTSGARLRRPSHHGAQALTPSERRIAALVTDGLTNREIAQSLFLTPKTVEFHLRNIFRKLDIGSRRELRKAVA